MLFFNRYVCYILFIYFFATDFLLGHFQNSQLESRVSIYFTVVVCARKVPHRLISLHTAHVAPVGHSLGTIRRCGLLGGVALQSEVCHWGWALRLQKPCAILS